MGPILKRLVLTFAFSIIVLMELCEAGRRKKHMKQKEVSRETNIFNFIRLLVLRVIYGVATSMGFGDTISEVFGGIFVPPGAEDDDYGELDF